MHRELPPWLISRMAPVVSLPGGSWFTYLLFMERSCVAHFWFELFCLRELSV